MATLTGSCLCGGITYRYDGPLGAIVHCHCSRCRRWHGAAFRTRAVARRAGFEWTAGAELVARYAMTPRTTKTFCRTCGSSLITEYARESDRIALPLGGVVGELDAGPAFHIFVASKASWHTITDDLPQFAELPPDPASIHRLPDDDRG